MQGERRAVDEEVGGVVAAGVQLATAYSIRAGIDADIGPVFYCQPRREKDAIGLVGLYVKCPLPRGGEHNRHIKLHNGICLCISRGDVAVALYIDGDGRC